MNYQMLEVAASRTEAGIITLCQDAVSFALSSDVPTFDRILLKELIHHIAATEMPTLYSGLRKQSALQ